VERGPYGGWTRNEHQEECERKAGQRHVRQLVWEHEETEHDEERNLRNERNSLVERDKLAPVADGVLPTASPTR
jgi:hypothetical protein